jgi:hypothetical protein
MPITPKEFKDGLESQEAELLAILEKKPYQAYALSDFPMPSTNSLILGVAYGLALHARLDRLVEKGLAKSKRMRGATYYMSNKA